MLTFQNNFFDCFPSSFCDFLMNQHPTNVQNTLVSKILQVALGLFVTTSDLPTLSHLNENLTYDCSFETACRWISSGEHVDGWRTARGEPDSLLWLAATGTMQIPREPYALIESRGSPVDSLITDVIRCQNGLAQLSFTFWVIGETDIEICLVDMGGDKFNCTGNLNSLVMPGKVSMKIPELQTPFRIMIQPNSSPGVIVLDDIRYDVSLCHSELISESKQRGRPYFMTTKSPQKVRPGMVEKSSASSRKPELLSSTQIYSVLTTEKSHETSIKNSTEKSQVPFDLLIIGNKTAPLVDKRTGNVIKNSKQLLCDFNDEFSCQWGPEAGRWAVIEKGAIPSLENSIMDPTLLPTFPAGLVLQGTAMLSSDPIKCQTGNSKILFRYWSNGDILLQVCALGHGNGSNIIHCYEQSKLDRNGKNTLAVFEMNKEIEEVFTLNIIPQWQKGLKNRFLVIDEIAYIGQCKVNRKELKPVPEHNKATQLPLTKTTYLPIQVESSTRKSIMTEKTKSSETFEKENHTRTKVKTTHERKVFTTFAPVFPEDSTKWSTSGPDNSMRSVSPQTTFEPKHDDYCDLLNCSFDDTACNYLNHGLTKKPWTLRNRGYGYPLTGTTDVRATQTNGQFVSAILDTGDIAILESPKFNATKSLNVLLFQYFRPSQMTTIRLCLGSRYTNPMRTISSFTQCPSILRSVTSKNAYRWNTVHIQLPPGTSHFYLVAHNNEKAVGRAAIAVDNIRVAICDTRGFAPDYIDETTDFASDVQF